MSWLAIFYAIYLTWVPIYDTQVYDIQMHNNVGKNLYTIQLDIDLKVLKYWYIGGKIKTSMKNLEVSHTFLPIESSYELHTFFKIKNIEVGFRHQCIHSMSPFEYKVNYTKTYNSAYEEFYIGVSNN